MKRWVGGVFLALVAVVGATVTAVQPWVAGLFGSVALGLLVLLGLWLRQQLSDLRHRLVAQSTSFQRAQTELVAGTEAKLTDLQDRVVDLSRLTAEHAGEVRKFVEGHTRNVLQEARNHFRQLEALQNLYKITDVRGPLPASRGWAVSPDLLLTYVGEILVRRPSLIVECGSGLSTVWAAYALERCGGEGRVVALEHDDHYAARSRDLLGRHGLTHRAEVRYAPIETVDVDEEPRPWYDVTAIKDLHDIDVLFVDGPIGELAPQARYPALPLLRGRLSPGAVVFLDDAVREDERLIAARWVDEWPGLIAEHLPHEKGAVRLVVPHDDSPR